MTDKILNIFKENNVRAGEKLNKRIVTDQIKSWGSDVADVRNAWHSLIGYGLLQQSGDELILTGRGEKAVYQE